MKAIMYHYVRPYDPTYPYFQYLDIDNFVRQLEFLGNHYGFVSKEQMLECVSEARPTRGVVLTFDDGFVDHFKWVLPEMRKSGLWGIFYIPTAPLTVGRILDVHRIHLLLGRYGGEEIADALGNLICEEMLSDKLVNEFRTSTYLKQDNEGSVNFVKRTLNYFIDARYRTIVIDDLMATYYPSDGELVQSVYMSKAMLSEMQDDGMTLGSHSVSHCVMSQLSIEEQENEIRDSFNMLEMITGSTPIKTFCYPYGGYHTFSRETEALLDRFSCLFSFNVESRDISRTDLAERRQALPRFDCNEFPHGTRGDSLLPGGCATVVLDHD